jgi:sarcosine oxidase subunit gamma
MSMSAEPVVQLPTLQIVQEGHRISLLRLWKAQVQHFGALSDAFDLAWPVLPNTVAGVVPRILWLAPDTWALVGSSASAIRERTARALGTRLHHVSDVGEGRAVFCIRGAIARAVLSKGCSLDLHPRELSPGRCAQSLLAQVPILIEPIEDTEPAAMAYRLYTDVSYEKYLRTWFADAVIEYS